MRPGYCPVCNEPNRCRMENGDAYKGACWCETLTLFAATVRRLSDALPQDRCLCPRCLEVLAENPDFTLSELAARRTAPQRPEPRG